MVDEQELPADLGVTKQAGGHQGVQPGRGRLSRDVAALGDGVDAAVGLFEQHRQEPSVAAARCCSPGPLGDVVLTGADGGDLPGGRRGGVVHHVEHVQDPVGPGALRSDRPEQPVVVVLPRDDGAREVVNGLSRSCS